MAEFEIWKGKPEQKNITQGAENKHMEFYRAKINRLMKDFEVLLKGLKQEG